MEIHVHSTLAKKVHIIFLDIHMYIHGNACA